MIKKQFHFKSQLRNNFNYELLNFHGESIKYLQLRFLASDLLCLVAL